MRFKQLLLLHDLPIDSSLEEVRDGHKGKAIVGSLIKFMRIAAFFKYVTQHPQFVNSKPVLMSGKSSFYQILKANLVGDEKELFYLCLFANIRIRQIAFNSIVPDKFIEIYKIAVEKLKKVKSYKKGVEIKTDNSEKIIKENTPEVSPKAIKNTTADPNYFHSIFQAAEPTSPRGSEGSLILATPVQTSKTKMPSLANILDIKSKDIEFSMVDLPENFYDCYHAFIYKSCEICEKRQAKNDLHICLLCGSIMCTHHCSPDQKGLGNLCKHSLSYHGGNCAFLDTYTGQYTIYENMRFFVLPGLYVNNIGLGVKESKLSSKDLKQFHLDQDKLNTIKKDLLQLNISKQIVNRNIVDNAVFRPGWY